MHFPLAGRGDDRNVAHPDLRAPPCFVVSIPANRALESFFEAALWLPIDEALQFRSVGSVSKHLPGPAADKLYLAIARTHRAQHRFSDFQHAAMSFGADVDYFTANRRDRSVNECVERFAVIFDKEPVTCHLAIAVNSQRFTKNHTRDEPRHSLFKMLVWSIVIERTHDDCRNVVSRPVRVNESIRATLRRRIRTHRIQRMFLRHPLADCGPVNFRSRDVNESIDAIAMFDDSIGDGLRAEHVGLKEKLVVVDRARDVDSAAMCTTMSAWPTSVSISSPLRTSPYQNSYRSEPSAPSGQLCTLPAYVSASTTSSRYSGYFL